ncbi:multidrug effflux MFS transporter [Falsiroseomonas selenitidurans]|uniref:Bcr/CflA family efflux transporter n=1 Tax=Falsiroseomonas selenitidurans TaxID=2716335 RepID=A0ABX1DWH9_9PROT|nr:multidrug effflux MFS transporter [Falsiroseomonas selenitidurans]NKC29256.1 multidrug effflux MFS transporter [Falsiroseomonas selenitidurans]
MPRWLPLLLGFLTAVGPLSTDMYLPAFPAIEAELGQRWGGVQATLSAWFLGLAFGQLVQGTLADRLGRRRPLIIGTAVYTLASIGCALASDMLALSLFRCIAAFGGAASAVIPRAMVRDLATGLDAARLMSRLMLVMGAAPILAPTLGGLLLEAAGWRAIFWVSAFYGLASCLLAWVLLPETLPPERRLRRSPLALVGDFGRIGVERGFLANALMGGATMFMVFVFIGGAPEVYIAQFGIAPAEFGLLFAASATGFIGLTQLNPWLLQRIGAQVPRLALRVCLGAVLLLTLSAFTGWGGFLGLYLPACLALACSGLVFPNSAVGALARHGVRAGSASALLGTLQFGLAALGAALVGALTEETAQPMALLMLAGVAGALVADGLRPTR